MRRLFLLAGLLLAATQSVRGGGLIIIEDPEGVPDERLILPHPHPWPSPPSRPWAPLEVSSTHVECTIEEQVAKTRVEQEFYNPGPRRLEGTFLFPVPKGAQIDDFRMEINGRMVEAELLTADKARGLYEGIVRKLKDPALLEYSGRDLFKARIFPIEPHSRKRVSLSYSEILEADSGLVGYRFPLNTEKYSAKPIGTLSLKVEVKSDRALKAIYSPSHEVEVSRHGEDRATVGFEGSNVKPDLDFQLFFAREEGEFGVSLLTRRLEGEDGYFLMLVSPGAAMERKEAVPKDIAFVLDTSGSMSGKKLAQAKKALLFCVENLNDGDRFDVLRFSTEVEPLFGKLSPADGAARTRAVSFIEALKPIGGTAIDEALRRALALRPEDSARPYVVVFLTDGRPTVGNTDANVIVKGVRGAKGHLTRIFCFGIGTDVNTHLLDRITEETKAYSQYVLPNEDLEVKVSSFYTKIKEPVLANLSIHAPEGVQLSRMYPSPLPDLFKGQQLVVAGRYSGRAEGKLRIEGTVNGERREVSYDVAFPATADRHEFIPRLWATRRVGYLLDEMRLHGENGELREEITELARGYGIVTPYTSYLIVEDEQRRGVPVARRSLGRDEARQRVDSRAYLNFLSAEDGDSAVAGARSSLKLKKAEASSVAIVSGNMEAARAVGDARLWQTNAVVLTRPAPAFGLKPMEPVVGDGLAGEPTSRFVGAKTFYWNAGKWIDSAIQGMTDPRRVKLGFGTEEYFAFLSRHPQAAQWMSLGTDVEVVVDGVVYEVRAATGP